MNRLATTTSSVCTCTLNCTHNIICNAIKQEDLLSQKFATGNDTGKFLLIKRFVRAEKYTHEIEDFSGQKHSVNLSTAVEIMQSFLNYTAYSYINECSPREGGGGGGGEGICTH